MNYSFIICSSCKLNVGFLNCCTCHKKNDFVICNGLQVNCPQCINCKLDLYYQSDEDVQLHQQCERNSQKMYYLCQCCNGYFCYCVEQQLEKNIILSPNESLKIQRDQ